LPGGAFKKFQILAILDQILSSGAFVPGVPLPKRDSNESYSLGGSFDTLKLKIQIPAE